MKTYKIACHVPEDKLQALIKYYEALGVTGFSVQLQLANTPAVSQAITSQAIPQKSAPIKCASQPSQHKSYYVGGVRNKGISARDLVLQILNNAPNPIVKCKDMRVEFVKHGFAKTSISSPLSILQKEKKIFHVGAGRWVLKQRYVVGAAANGGLVGV